MTSAATTPGTAAGPAVSAVAGWRLPTVRGGWWHHYVCPAHGVELEAVGLAAGTYPTGGVPCRYGCTVDGPGIEGAWYVFAHQAAARHIRVLAHAGAHDAATELLVAYARIRATLTAGGEHDGAQPWMLRGRLFQQALTEAQWATSVGHAVWTLAAAGASGLDPVLPLLDGLAADAAAARDTLVRDGRFASNYTAWLNAAGAVTSRAAALVRGGAAGTRTDDPWLAGEHGLYAWLGVAVGPDGWEWEGSSYYHGFVLRAALLALRGTDPAAWPPAAAGRLRAMVAVLAAIATDGGIVPALHDGPYARPLLALEWLELVALARQLDGDVEPAAHVPPVALDAVAGRARADAGPLDDGLDRRLGGWFAGRPAPAPAAAATPAGRAPVTVFATAGYAVVRTAGVHAVLDFGPHGGSHGHRDKLALYLYGADASWQPDPGQVPYGHRAWRAAYASTALHPAFAVDGADQAESAGRLVAATGDTVTAAADGCYPGVVATRTVVAGRGHLVDVLRVRADRPRVLSALLRPGGAFDVRVEVDRWCSVWRGGPGLHGVHRCSAPAAPLVTPGPGTADNPSRSRSRVDWTADDAQDVVFCSVYRTGDAPPVDAVRLAGDTVVVETAGGAVTYPIGVQEAAC